MQGLIVKSGPQLRGKIHISGAKNAALALMPAALLTDQPLRLVNMPRLSDTQLMQELMQQFGVDFSLGTENGLNWVEMTAAKIKDTCAPYDIVRKMRASIFTLGPLVARTGQADVSLPGGCAIGTRPVDFYINGLTALGAQIELENGYVRARAPHGLKGAKIVFPFASVGATESMMMAATLAQGESELVNAAREPEVIDLANCLIAMGAKIEGAGTDIIRIQGQPSLHGATHRIIADRIEAGTYVMAAAITGGDLELLGGNLNDLAGALPVLEKAGIVLTPTQDGYRASRTGQLIGIDAMTEPFPGFATDLQAQYMALMCVANGAAMITETIFENRFMHAPELMRLGANITIHGGSALVRGVPKLKGASVMATDLRASVSLVLAGLVAEGETIINRIYHLDRGYENLEKKLAQCGALIERVDLDDAA